MKKKIAYMLIGALCSIILSYGFVAYADHDSSSTTTEDKPTAASDTYVVPPASPATPKPATAQSSPSAEPIKLDQLKDLELKIAGNGLKIEIEFEREQAKAESKVDITYGQDQEKHLTGSEAAQFIQQLLDAVKLQENMNNQQVMDALFKHFAVEPAKMASKIEIKLTNRLEVLKYEKEKDDDDNANVQQVQKDQDDQKEQRANKDQLTQQEQKKAQQVAWQKAHKELQAKKKQQKSFARGDRDDDHHDGEQNDENDNDHDDDHGQHESHDHEDHEDED